MSKSYIATQDWYEDATEKTGWFACGWLWEIDGTDVDETKWKLYEILERDKYHNPIKATFRMNEHNYTELKESKGIHTAAPTAIVQIKDNHIAIGGTVYEMESMPKNVAFEIQENTPVLMFNGVTYRGKAIPGVREEKPKQQSQKPAYAITAYRNRNLHTEVYRLNSHGKYENGDLKCTPEEIERNPFYEICAVKNIHGTTFTVGDYCTFKYMPADSKPMRIAKFFLNRNQFVYVQTTGGAQALINDLVPARPLFVTHDNMPIYERDENLRLYAVVHENVFETLDFTPFQIYNWTGKGMFPDEKNQDRFKLFADKEKAESYVRLHKPSLSLEAIHKTFFACARNHHENLLLTKLYNQLKERV